MSTIIAGQCAGDCSAKRHMSIQEYGLYQDSLKRCLKHGSLLWSDRAVADWFGNASKDIVCRIRVQLIKRGWFVVVRKPGFHPVTHKKTPTCIRVLSHAQWMRRSMRKPVAHTRLDRPSKYAGLRGVL
jgi:hypothetical protein